MPKNILWNSLDESLLIENYKKLGIFGCAKLLNRTEVSIRKKAIKLNILKRSAVYWKSEDELFLLNNYKLLGINQCSAILNRTIKSLNKRLSKITKRRLDLWNDREIKFLKEFYSEYGSLYCSIFMGRNRRDIVKRACMYGVAAPNRKTIITKNIFLNLVEKGLDRHEIAKLTNKCAGRIDQLAKIFNIKVCKNRWSIKDRDWLKENYSKHGAKYCSEILKKSITQIRKKSRNLKIKLDYKEYFKNHPDDIKLCWTGIGISHPCEKLKRELLKLNIQFKDEVMPLLHINKRYRADILINDKKLIIEINGGQHYSSKNKKYKLGEYYQIRHDLLINNGWRVFEIPCAYVYKTNFLNNLLVQIDGKDSEYDLNSVNN